MLDTLCVQLCQLAYGIQQSFEFDNDTQKTDWEKEELAWQVHAPAVMLCMVGIIAAQLLSRKVSMDAIEQRSSSASVKEACKSCWTNAGVVSALALSFNMNNIMSAPQSAEPTTLVAQWYGDLMLISSAYNVIAIVLSVVSLLYVEGFSDDATALFLKQMPYVLGRPICFMCLGLLTFFLGLLLNILTLYGSSAFSFSLVLTIIITIYCLLEWIWIGGWENTVDSARASQYRSLS
eukprot:TRINITY_DN18378_c0_g1_i1.p1 TRINITY_DN18378_c0_g1~~TRINITY_DN18378_c0_g1_i1.p1  ORF type:complete len:235 (+),score=38.02 TRINITY_DN18378_c0_g1_i1:313-1017(+)